MREESQETTSSQCCRNCEAALPDNAFFCPRCGQRNTDGRVTFGELISHFLANLLNFDGRIFQTIGALVVPGKLTKDFFAGKHIRYYHPVRLFILSGALFIAMLSLTASRANLDAMDKIWKSREDAYALKKVATEIDTLCTDIKQEMNTPAVAVALDSLKSRFTKNHLNAIKDSVKISDVISIGTTDSLAVTKVALDDLISLKGEELADKYGVTGLWDRQIFLQNIRIQKSLKGFLYYMIGNTLWMVLIMMPMLAVALKLLYIRHDYLYIEHLIFSFHTHTFIFLFYSLLLLAGLWAGYEFLNYAILLIGVYLLMAIKKFYGQNWGKTILKFLLASVFYFGVMIVAIIITTIASMFLF